MSNGTDVHGSGLYDWEYLSSDRCQCKQCRAIVSDAISQNPLPDMIAHPPHYNSDPSGIEPIEISKHMAFPEGNVIKYVMRAKHKGSELEDLKKARFYIDVAIEIARESK